MCVISTGICRIEQYINTYLWYQVLPWIKWTPTLSHKFENCNWVNIWPTHISTTSSSVRYISKAFSTVSIICSKKVHLFTEFFCINILYQSQWNKFVWHSLALFSPSLSYIMYVRQNRINVQTEPYLEHEPRFTLYSFRLLATLSMVIP